LLILLKDQLLPVSDKRKRNWLLFST